VSAAVGASDIRAGGDQDRVALLAPALWKRLTDAKDIREFATAWLALQSGMIPGVTRGLAVLVPSDSGPQMVDAPWPAGSDTAMFGAVIDAALAQRLGVVRNPGNNTGERRAAHLAFPIVIDDAACGAVAIECAADSDESLRAAMRQLQWGVAWLRERLRVERAAGSARAPDRARVALDIFAVALEQEHLAAACRAVVTELALRFDCERVSIGFVRGGRIRVAAISHSAQFGKQMSLVRLLAEAMDEAIDQQASILHPTPPSDPHVTRAHEQLANGHGSGVILTIPLFVRDRFIGALTFERRGAKPFDAEDVRVLDAITAAAAPILEEKRQNSRWLIVKVGEAVAAQAKRLLGPGYAARKLAIVAACVLAAVGYLWTDTYRVVADAVIEGEIQRSVVAPFNGFIKEAPAHAGDTLRAGQLLAALDDRDLMLERLKWVTDRQRRVLEYERALGERNRAESRIVQAQIEQADAQIRLVDEQLARTRLVAPFDGLVVSGDLTQSVGSAVQRGQMLFEVAPLDRYRVILEVDETQIGDLAEGRTGQLVVSSLPLETFPVAVTKLTPVARARDGHNFFRVEARIEGPSGGLRPGMRGAAKIDVDQRRVVWIWTRAFIDWARLFAWRWLA
jgi:multidrug efflux pump subunit AcrA (membrane-fusion protein)